MMILQIHQISTYMYLCPTNKITWILHIHLIPRISKFTQIISLKSQNFLGIIRIGWFLGVILQAIVGCHRASLLHIGHIGYLRYASGGMAEYSCLFRGPDYPTKWEYILLTWLFIAP